MDEDNDGRFPDDSPVLVRYPRDRQEEQDDRSVWPWLSGSIQPVRAGRVIRVRGGRRAGHAGRRRTGAGWYGSWGTLPVLFPGRQRDPACHRRGGAVIPAAAADSWLFWLAIIDGLAAVYILPTVIGIARRVEGIGLVICLNAVGDLSGPFGRAVGDGEMDHEGAGGRAMPLRRTNRTPPAA